MVVGLFSVTGEWVTVAHEEATARTIARTTRGEKPSCRRRPAGGFTFEVQQVTGEDLGRGIEVKTLSWGVIIRANQTEQAVIGECSEVGFSRQASTHATDGILDTALLPRGMSITEKGSHR